MRKDFIPFYRKLGRDKFLEVLKENPTAPEDKLKAIYKEMIKDVKKEKKPTKQIDLFDHDNQG